MANSFKVKIITPARVFYEGQAELLVVPTLVGEEGFMANHAWATILLGVGEMGILEAGQTDMRIASLAGGFIDVKDKMVVYSDNAEWADEIDIERAKREKELVESWMQDNKMIAKEIDLIRAQVALDKSISRLNVGSGGRRNLQITRPGMGAVTRGKMPNLKDNNDY